MTILRFRLPATGFLRAAGLVFLLGAVSLRAADPKPLRVLVSNETAPAGGWVQMKINLETPATILGGSMQVDFDAATIEQIETGSAFSASGDATGAGTIDVKKFVLRATSFTGGMGQLPEVPIFVLTVKLKSDVAPGTVIPVPVTFQPDTFTGSDGTVFTTTAVAGSITVGGSLDIRRVSPGGGLLPAGTVVHVTGKGFTPATTVAVDGAAISAAQFVSSEAIDFTLLGPTELTGKKVTVREAGETQVYFSAVSHTPTLLSVGGIRLPGFQPVFPSRPWSSATFAIFAPNSLGNFVAVENPTATPQSAKVQGILGPNVLTEETLQIPAGATAYSVVTSQQVLVTPSSATLPVRVAAYGLC